jgi:L-fucose mutarotase/ribose pyranase (RbsD/FucU family)
MPAHQALGWKTQIWDTYKEIVSEGEGRNVALTTVERFEFYARSKQAYAVIATG